MILSVVKIRYTNTREITESIRKRKFLEWFLTKILFQTKNLKKFKSDAIITFVTFIYFWNYEIWYKFVTIFSHVTVDIAIYLEVCVACSSNLYPKLKNMTFPVKTIYGYVFSNQLQVCNKQTSSLGWSKFEFRKINFVIMIFFLKMPLKSKTLITYWVPLQHRYIFSTKNLVITQCPGYMSHLYESYLQQKQGYFDVGDKLERWWQIRSFRPKYSL